MPVPFLNIGKHNTRTEEEREDTGPLSEITTIWAPRKRKATNQNRGRDAKHFYLYFTVQTDKDRARGDQETDRGEG